MARLLPTAALLLAAGCGPAAVPAPPPPPPAPEVFAGGKYEVVGVRGGGAGGKMVSESGSRRTNDPVTIEWAVGASTYAALAEGMTLAEARAALGLAVLAFTPWGEASEFVLVCKQEPVTVTLTFAGSPDVRLVGKAAVGYE